MRRRPPGRRSIARIIAAAAAITTVVAIACAEEAQTDAVDRFNERADTLVRLACLDLNRDGVIDTADAQSDALFDVTGDGAVDDADRAIVSRVEIELDEPAPEARPDEHPTPDWQVSPPSEVDCNQVSSGVLLFGVGGGGVNLADRTNAAGVRWMLWEAADALEEEGYANQLASIAPAVNGAANGHRASEAWTFAYLDETMRRRPCLSLFMLGHSHGGVSVTAAAARLEEAGLGDRVLLSALIDRFPGLYDGDTASLPQTTPVFHAYLSKGELTGDPIEQPNVENWDALGVEAPQRGERGGPSRPADHSTVDNSPAVLEQVLARLMEQVQSQLGPR